MPYGDLSDRYYINVYAPAVEAAGLRPVRADSLFRPSPILEDIWRFTRDSQVLLADLSGRNPNVFYEVGLAHAIAKPVVLVAASMQDVPFDLRGLRVLVYDKNNESWGADLKAQVTAALNETLADLHSAIPPTFLRPAPAPPEEEDPIRLDIRKLQDEIRALRFSQTPEPEREVIYVDKPIPVAVPQAFARTLRSEDPQLFSPIQDDAALEVVAVWLATDRKIHAIKKIREVSTLGLKEAKDLVDLAMPVVKRLLPASLSAAERDANG
jgi:ribosomal protein L7/L12